MTRKEIKQHALESLKGNWGLAVSVTLVVYSGFYYLLPFLLEISLSGWVGESLSILGVDLLNFIIQIVIIPLSVGTTWFFLELSRKQPGKLKDVFIVYSDSKLALKTIGLSLLVGLFVLLWMLLLIIPGIIKSIAYSQVYYILKDKPELTVFEAIKESNKLMEGYKWKYFILNLSFIGWVLLSAFSFGIGFIFLIPYMNTSLASFYDDISNQNKEVIS
ncbi:DUF975 family protein [Chengkuizengella sediminis]|uniref:DUF975 family protein n=1 Tax=Chengkuizengella sediminis TaxID=1885917 RepID=UPI00138A08E4|nr:DUF975 family protein [Chengkuizengella sediminis]NDI34295.1 DUF975 family protein [Chengkuizengella sediminis]